METQLKGIAGVFSAYSVPHLNLDKQNAVIPHHYVFSLFFSLSVSFLSSVRRLRYTTRSEV